MMFSQAYAQGACNKTLTLQRVNFRVTCANEASQNTLRIAPSGAIFRRCLANEIPYSIGIGAGSKPMFSSGFSMRHRRTQTWSTRCLLPISLTPRKKQQKTALQDAFIIIRNQRHQRLITKARDRHGFPILGRQRRVVQHQDRLTTQHRAFAR